jgi:hypothetical protein
VKLSEGSDLLGGHLHRFFGSRRGVLHCGDAR